MLGEGKRIQLRREVTGTPRVGIVTPRPAWRGRLLEDDEIPPSRLEEFDGCADPTESGTQDDHVRECRITPHFPQSAKPTSGPGRAHFEIETLNRI
jgi:hypothetical protein